MLTVPTKTMILNLSIIYSRNVLKYLRILVLRIYRYTSLALKVFMHCVKINIKIKNIKKTRTDFSFMFAG